MPARQCDAVLMKNLPHVGMSLTRMHLERYGVICISPPSPYSTSSDAARASLTTRISKCGEGKKYI
jgi:hypothetical protein